MVINQNELIISDLQHKLHFRRTVSYMKEHFENVSAGKPDYGISKCISADSIYALDSSFAKKPEKSNLTINETGITVMLTCFQIISRIIKTAYGEGLFNLVLNKGYKKSSKKEFLFLSQEWKYRNELFTENIYKLFPQVQPIMEEISTKTAEISAV